MDVKGVLEARAERVYDGRHGSDEKRPSERDLVDAEFTRGSWGQVILPTNAADDGPARSRDFQPASELVRTDSGQAVDSSLSMQLSIKEQLAALQAKIAKAVTERAERASSPPRTTSSFREPSPIFSVRRGDRAETRDLDYGRPESRAAYMQTPAGMSIRRASSYTQASDDTREYGRQQEQMVTSGDDDALKTARQREESFLRARTGGSSKQEINTENPYTALAATASTPSNRSSPLRDKSPPPVRSLPPLPVLKPSPAVEPSHHRNVSTPAAAAASASLQQHSAPSASIPMTPAGTRSTSEPFSSGRDAYYSSSIRDPYTSNAVIMTGRTDASLYRDRDQTTTQTPHIMKTPANTSQKNSTMSPHIMRSSPANSRSPHHAGGDETSMKIADIHSIAEDIYGDEKDKAPFLSYANIFARFLTFGCSTLSDATMQIG
jgi:hypothetical protein